MSFSLNLINIAIYLINNNLTYCNIIYILVKYIDI